MTEEDYNESMKEFYKEVSEVHKVQFKKDLTINIHRIFYIVTTVVIMYMIFKH